MEWFDTIIEVIYIRINDNGSISWLFSSKSNRSEWFAKKKGVEFVSMKNIEGMKKIIEEKKKLSAQQGVSDEKPNQRKVNKHKAFKTTKRGGFFDK